MQVSVFLPKYNTSNKYFKIFMIVCGSWVFSDPVTFIALVIFLSQASKEFKKRANSKV